MDINDLKKYIEKTEDIQEVRKVLKEHGFFVDEPLTVKEIELVIKKGELNKLKPHELCYYSSHLSLRGDWKKAEEIANLLNDEDERGQALACLAQNLAKSGFIERAKNIALSIPSNAEYSGALYEKISALIKIADELAKLKSIDKLSEITEIIESEIKLLDLAFDKAQLYLDLAIVLEPIIETSNAIRYLEKAVQYVIDDLNSYMGSSLRYYWEEIKLLKYIVIHLAETGFIDKAHKITELIINKKYKQHILRELNDFVKKEH